MLDTRTTSAVGLYAESTRKGLENERADKAPGTTNASITSEILNQTASARASANAACIEQQLYAPRSIGSKVA